MIPDRVAVAKVVAEGISGLRGAIPERDDFEIADAVLALLAIPVPGQCPECEAEVRCQECGHEFVDGAVR